MIYTVTLNPALDYFMAYDRVEIGDVNRTKVTRMTPGGKGIMESRMLSLLKTENTALGFIGGFTGQAIKDSLITQGIQTDFTEIQGQSRVNVKLKTAASETSLDAAGPDLTAEDIERFLAKFDLLQANDIVALAGTAPKSLGDTFYEVLIEKIVSKGANFAIDVDGQKLLRTLAQKPLVVKPNREELEAIFDVTFNEMKEIIPYGKKLLEMGAKNVMVSMAGDGALLFSKEDVYFAAPVKNTIKNSVGAGDSTVAGFIAEWSKSQDPLKSFKQGVACGTAKVFSDDMPTEAFLTSCFDQIKIEKIN
ncbi:MULTISPECIES: 1-phosphofructokinase [unclassified Lactococcus]|uniref:1-phosphofructokinase n=1 Tax=unclassified Lactococcus TaxID=2643510 RepID=UPI0011CC68C7|nr:MULTISPECIES: 1-phosphofructokinase [unclassified Lactococcus]MQW23831.1 1-phosphofructokinase [Lactococcus sp. dk101]TXK37344.1 1-phosphofructokinase [Lactococcus sp. dk310]TXK48656.1 1-phosphofructokinase [Lactococcus sp. dk322]